MARQKKKLPARRRDALDESLLIRSAESLGRVIGSLQRQLDAARRLVGPVSVDQRTNGHAPARQRSGVVTKKPSAKAVKSKSATTAKGKTTTARKRSASSGRTAKSR